MMGDDLIKRLIMVPAYDERGYLPETLKALTSLNDGIRYDVIVVDDGSRDGTGDIARERGFKVLTNNERLGKTQAIRKGIEYGRANGFAFVATIDADTTNLKAEMVDSLFAPLMEKDPEGKPRYLMSVGHIIEGGHSEGRGRNYDLSWSGQRAFNIEAFDGWFLGDRHWEKLMEEKWPELGFRYLIPERKTAYLPGLAFSQRAENRYGENIQDTKSREYWVEQETAWKRVEVYAIRGGLKPARKRLNPESIRGLLAKKHVKDDRVLLG